MMAAILSACAGSGSAIAPAHHASNGARSTPVTFTMHWTNPTATAALRRKDTISPSAASIAVTVDGNLVSTANRGMSPTQSIVLDAPVGTDTFIFKVYDQADASGNLLGTATVAQQIVDGAANVVSASIQAVCAATNVTATSALAYMKNAAAVGVIKPGLGSLVLMGTSSATLVVAPEDVDGNVIITPGSVNASYTFSGSATVTQPVAGQLKLVPVTGPRTTTPDTLNVAAPGCASQSIAVQHSPAIYVTSNNSTVTVFDWYGDAVLNAHLLTTYDNPIGYDVRTGLLVTYNFDTGVVSENALNLSSQSPLYTIPLFVSVAWSNYFDGVFIGSYNSGANQSTYSAYAGGTLYTQIGSATSDQVIQVAASTFSASPAVFETSGTANRGYSLATRTLFATYTQPNPTNAIAPDDNKNVLHTFPVSGNAYVYDLVENTLGFLTGATYSFTDYAQAAAVDTDADNIYIVTRGGTLEAVSPSNGATLFTFPFGTANGITVISANER